MKQNIKNRIYLYASVALLVGVFVGYIIFQNNAGVNNFRTEKQNSQNKQLNRGNCLADDCLQIDNLEYPVGELSANAKEALNEAINDEYKALSTYEKVIAKFGAVRPFSMIKGAEEQHIASLKTIFDKYGLKVPSNTWANKITVPATLRESCQLGVEAEIANANLYKTKLLPKVQEYEDITVIFTNLMNASEQKHLAAFSKCD